MKKGVYFVLILLFIFSSCVKKQSAEKVRKAEYLNEITFDRHAPVEIISVDFDSLFEDYEPVVLEQGVNNNIIGEISNILEHNDTLYIIDARKAKSVTIYNKHGRFLRAIGSIGKGPGEYLAIKHVRLNRGKRRLELHDNFQGKLIFFDLKGNFLEERRIFAFADFIYSEIYNKYYFYVLFSTIKGKNRYRLIVTDDNFQFLAGHFPYTSEQDNNFLGRLKNNFYKTGDGKIFFTEVFSNRIYEIIDTEIIQTHSLKFKNPPEEHYIDNLKKSTVNSIQADEDKYDHLEGHMIIENSFIHLNYAEAFNDIIYHVSVIDNHLICYNGIKHTDNFQLFGFNFYDPDAKTLTFPYNQLINRKVDPASKIGQALSKLNPEFLNPILIVCKLKK